MLPAVVLIAVWDKKNHRIVSLGSGFIACKRRGLIITASHILFNFDSNSSDPDQPKILEGFCGLPDATAIIGMNHQGNGKAVFTYSADVVASDVYNVDGCVLQIKKKFVKPIELDHNQLSLRTELPISSGIRRERLQHLMLTSEYEMEQEVRVLGFRQTGEGLLAARGVINRVPCVNKGFVCKRWDNISDESGKEFMPRSFMPRSEIVVSCSTGGGNSGGPFVNESGEVIGILSRSDQIEVQRCYLTPAKELKILLRKAKKKCDKESHLPLQSPFEEDNHF
jgi:hypothetical protein